MSITATPTGACERLASPTPNSICSPAHPARSRPRGGSFTLPSHFDSVHHHLDFDPGNVSLTHVRKCPQRQSVAPPSYSVNEPGTAWRRIVWSLVRIDGSFGAGVHRANKAARIATHTRTGDCLPETAKLLSKTYSKRGGSGLPGSEAPGPRANSGSLSSRSNPKPGQHDRCNVL